MKATFRAFIDKHLPLLKYSARSDFIRDAIKEKLEAHKIAVPPELALGESRAGKSRWKKQAKPAAGHVEKIREALAKRGKLPPEVWAHYQKLGTNLAALDAKNEALRTAYLAEIKASGALAKKGRITSQEYQARTQEIQARFDTTRAPIDKAARALAEQRQAIESKYKFKRGDKSPDR